MFEFGQRDPALEFGRVAAVGNGAVGYQNCRNGSAAVGPVGNGPRWTLGNWIWPIYLVMDTAAGLSGLLVAGGGIGASAA